MSKADDKMPRTYVPSHRDCGVIPLQPQGTNSTMFTECCRCAILDDETKCPRCGRLVIGHDAATKHERGRIRWKAATGHWKRSRSPRDSAKAE